MSEHKTSAYFEGALTAMRREVRDFKDACARLGDARCYQWADAVDYMSRLEDRIKDLERELAAAKEETK